jgi:DNA-3-methyladenine glycosylase I
MGDVVRDPDGVRRCAWAGTAPDNMHYHDTEWGRPVVDDARLYEKLCLEGFQSGLSWLTILRKRENFRRAFAGFDPARVAQFGARDVKLLLQDAGIVRHRGKIEAAIANARALVAVEECHGSLALLCWSFAPARRPAPVSFADVPAKTDSSKALSKELLRLGFRFVGPTTVYATMQAAGIVNDHLAGCAARAACEQDRIASRRRLRNAGLSHRRSRSSAAAPRRT